VEILETKVKKLEQLLRLKDAKIQVLHVYIHTYIRIIIFVVDLDV